jgi:hypothetical protein
LLHHDAPGRDDRTFGRCDGPAAGDRGGGISGKIGGPATHCTASTIAGSIPPSRPRRCPWIRAPGPANTESPCAGGRAFHRASTR